MSSSSSESSPSAAAAVTVPAWVATAPAAFLKCGGPFTGPVPSPKDNSSVNVLITGAARGIGLELTRQYASANSESIVFAGVRDAKSKTIVSLAAQYKNIVILPLEVTSDESVKESYSHVSKLVNHLDILVNNAGGRGDLSLPTTTSRQDLLSTFNLNAAAPMVVTQTYLPLLKNAKKHPGRVINMSTGMGVNVWADVIIKAFGKEVSNSYNVGKAALNYLTSIFAPSVPDVIFVAVSPGWVDTESSAAGAPVKVKDCVQALRYLIETRELKHSGKFFDNIDNGAELPF